MRGAILGLVLTLSAFVILKTINPQFITPTLTPLPGVDGIYLAKTVDNLKAAPQAESNIAGSEAISNGYNKIYYKCTNQQTAPALLIWKFPQPNFQGNDKNYTGVTVVRKKCGEMEPVGGFGSFKMAFETAGVYYFLGGDCTGLMSEANTTTQNKIPSPFTGNIKSVRFVNDPDNYDYYGAIFHSIPNTSKGSECTSPMVVGHNTTSAQNTCFNLADFSFPGFSAYSAEIFHQGYDPSSSSGDGVWFFSNVNGWDSGNKSGVSYINAQQIGTFFLKGASYFRFDYTGVSTSLADACNNNIICEDPEEGEEEEEKMCCFCSSPKDWNITSTSTDEEIGCGGSIRFGGNNYIVTLYTIIRENPDPSFVFNPENPLEGTKMYCQSFKKDAPNLSSGASFLPHGKHSLDYINIIPIH